LRDGQLMDTHQELQTRRKLGAMCKNDESAARFFKSAAGRTNDVAETPVGRIAQMAGSSNYQEALRLCRDLRDAGCGTLLLGRRGAQSRFRWDFSLKTIGQAALHPDSKLTPIDSEVQADQQAASSLDRAQIGSGLTIPEAKRLLAKSLGVSPEKIEIIVRG
jgi:hypothetical protein